MNSQNPNYLHGVNTREILGGVRPVKGVKSAVIGLIGTAPQGAVNTPTLVTSDYDAAQFGRSFSGFTIPQALKAISDHGVVTVVVVNVLGDSHYISASEAVTFSTATLSAVLQKRMLKEVVVKNTAATSTYQAGTDYLLEPADGRLTRLTGGSIQANETVTVTYKWPDPSQVTAADIIGGVSDAGRRTGLAALEDAFTLFGFDAKILIAPVFCTQNSVAVALSAMADKLDAVTYIDAPIGITVSQALSGRGTAGTINFNTSSPRVRLCYPHLKVYDTELKRERLEPVSSRAAALRARVDLDEGFWVSSSNHEIKGVTGMERPVSARIDDASCEANLLNENGITTVFNSFGTGIRLWGNRTAAWPALTHIVNFENVRRTADIINESIRLSSLQFQDRPVDNVLVDAILGMVDGYARRLIGDGALLGFSCWYDRARNTESGLANGRLIISYKFTPPVPMEWLTYEAEITSEYLVTIGGSN